MQIGAMSITIETPFCFGCFFQFCSHIAAFHTPIESLRLPSRSFHSIPHPQLLQQTLHSTNYSLRSPSHRPQIRVVDCNCCYSEWIRTHSDPSRSWAHHPANSSSTPPFPGYPSPPSSTRSTHRSRALCDPSSPPLHHSLPITPSIHSFAHSTPPSIPIAIPIDNENENGDIHDGTRRRLRRSFRSTQNNYSSFCTHSRTVIPAVRPMTPMAIITSAMRRSSSMERPKQLEADCVAALHPLVTEAATMKGSW